MNIYAFCDNNCKHLVYTREEVLSLLQQAINDGSLKNIDADFAAVKRVVDGNAGSDITFWTGTEAEFNALNPAPKVNHFIPRRGEDGKIYICIDDTSISNLPTTPLTAAEIKAICDGTYKTGDGDFVDAAGVGALWDVANDSFAVERVGDIKTTLRPTLGDKWVLCNGADLNVEEYPALADKVGWSAWVNKGNSHYCSDPRMFVFGDQILYGYRNSGSGTTSYFAFWYSSDGGNKFNDYTFSNSDANIWNVRVGGIYCSGGLWCVSSTYHSNACILYTTDPAAKGNWSFYTLDTSGTLNGIYCHNGTWVACGSDSNGVGCVWVSADPEAGVSSWTKHALGGEECIRAFCYNGKWGVAATDNTSGAYKIMLYTTDDITGGEWSENVVKKYTSGSDACVYGLYACDGKWAISCTYMNNYARVFYSNNPAGDWSEKEFEYYNPSSICCYGGVWHLVVNDSTSNCKPYLLTTSDMSNDVWNSELIYDGHVKPCEILVNGKGVFTTGQGASSSYYFKAYKKSKVLPEIEHDGAYTYIKVRE